MRKASSERLGALYLSLGVWFGHGVLEALVWIGGALIEGAFAQLLKVQLLDRIEMTKYWLARVIYAQRGLLWTRISIKTCSAGATALP